MSRRYTTITVEREVKEKLEEIIREAVGEVSWNELFRKMVSNRTLTLSYIRKLYAGIVEEDLLKIMVNIVELLYISMRKNGQLKDKETRILLYLTVRNIREKLKEHGMEDERVERIYEELTGS
ncbi:MAG: hypothetical protein GXO26_08100 [Crenarchaeota archaeon]|nr:hypothetical protein [Thermoproteota archaeon]